MVTKESNSQLFENVITVDQDRPKGIKKIKANSNINLSGY